MGFHMSVPFHCLIALKWRLKCASNGILLSALGMQYGDYYMILLTNLLQQFIKTQRLQSITDPLLPLWSPKMLVAYRMHERSVASCLVCRSRPAIIQHIRLQPSPHPHHSLQRRHYNSTPAHTIIDLRVWLQLIIP
ncbi:hypothetical protein P153DRAFT_222266 [Dothidotthia symphoricarpi CBS 119687]|uniref:Uncharacterized protein n=1 Tax=Dothidotthia symphoricarpi CBS 119687 TaxID=1392245 RepID=A0A6A6AHR6_9PLEO|nr:uncharacterized protein P153DRAFT_222266 [Dothidotthia symphoricarpi CBS 119687]KAF2130638.1 hypothetical protein P153DRAFT_222266 [Dothidotthia symphoricarpi CBS 119687]